MTKPSDTNGPSADVKTAIDSAFGSVDEMKSKFNAAAASRFGSGWAWLGLKEDGSLGITSTPNQARPKKPNNTCMVKGAMNATRVL